MITTGNNTTSVSDAVSATFSARSLALSLLLGSHPPELSTAALVSAGSLFGINAGTMRTALSRMSANGEVAPTGGGYELAGRLVERQRRQDAGRRAPSATWDGRWVTVTPTQSSRELADRRELRRRLSSAGFGELRPDFWLRPFNRQLPELGPDLLVTVGELRVDDVGQLVRDLWSLHDLDNEAQRLLAEMAMVVTREEALRESRRSSDDAGSWLVDAFTLSAEIVRFLTSEPQLPAALLPKSWSPNELRDRYDELETTFQRNLGRFLRSTTAAAHQPGGR